jgi:hypothetical protein
MPSPDVTNYVDLTVYDLQPAEIYDLAIEYAQTSLPEWTPVTGSIEDAILQAASNMTGYLLGAINRLPAGSIEGLLALFGVVRNTGQAANGTAKITFIDDTGYTLSAGTRFGYLETGAVDSTLYVFETTAGIQTNDGQNVNAYGQTEVSVGIRAVTLSRYPSLSDGTSLQLLSAVSFISSIELVGDLNPGGDAESDTDYLNRGATTFGYLSETLVMPSQFDRYVLATYPEAYRAKAFSRAKIERTTSALVRSSSVVTATIGSGHGIVAGDVVRISGATPSTFNGYFIVSGLTGSTSVYWSQAGDNASATVQGKLVSTKLYPLTPEVPQNGYLTIYVSGTGGASLTAASCAAIEEDLTSKAIAGLTIVVNNATIVPLNLSVEVTTKSGYLASSVSTNVQTALNQYLHPDYWGWGSTIYYNELISLIDRVDGVDRVVSLSITDPSGNYTTVDGSNLDFDYYGCLPSHTTTVTVSS